MRTAALFVFLFFGAILFASGQSYSTKSRSAIEHFQAANHSLDNTDYDDAIVELRKAISDDDKFIEAYAQLADVYRLRRDNSHAIENYRKVLAINPDFNRAIYIRAGEAEFTVGDYQNALPHLEKYVTYPNITPANMAVAQKLIGNCKFALNAMQHPVPFKPVNMGPEVNTPFDEYSPVATADEKTLIFTRMVKSNEDFYQSVRINNKWETAMPLSANINTPTYNEGSESISQDGKYLFFTGCNRPDGLGRCDIYFSERKGDDWSKPFDLPPPVNTAGWESQPSLSADGKTLFFVSNRPGGYGSYDIWESKLTDKGWGAPENLGPNINTAGSEQSPFIHADDSTLYFCSNGWPGMGGQDLFVSKLGKDGKWQKPENLGYPINTCNDESGLSISANGTTAYFSSNNLSGYGGFDIYTFELPVNIRPHLVTYVKGTVTDKKTKQPLEAAVEIIDLQNNLPVYQDYSSNDKGEFLATLKAGKNYALHISKDDYLFYSEYFSLEGHDAGKPFIITVSLEGIEIGGKTVLRNIFFDTNKFDLKPNSKSELEKLSAFLTQNPKLKVEISGHTDNVGNDQANQILSENRAKSVYNYLIDNKIDASRLTYKGYGRTQPIATNDTEEGRGYNRRTEFKIVGK
jgi:outer membrane protein OmpA-like peptidoglycan-associated protein